MGCWGTRIFDNDTAADWAHDLAKAKDLWFIEKRSREFLTSAMRAWILG
jgi:hypothetical protein